MKAYSTKNIRNVVLLGSTKSGKTTLSEAMIYERLGMSAEDVLDVLGMDDTLP